MNILLQANEKYCKYMSVMLLSLFENNKNEKMDIYVIYSSISDETRKKLTHFVKSYGNRITFLKCEKNLFAGFKTSSYLTIEMYYKLLAHLILPKTMERVMFLDIDIIINENIMEFYNTDFEGKYIVAAGQAPFVDYEHISDTFNVKLAASGKYFNVGVLLLNLKKFRKNRIGVDDYYKATEEIIKINPNFMYEQAIMNYMFGQYETKYLQVLEYNYRYHIEFENQKAIAQRNFKFNPKIIHYANWLIQYKPWDLRFTSDEVKKYGFSDIFPGFFNLNDNINSIMEIWWSYAERVPSDFYNIILQECRAKKDYFCSYVFNQLRQYRTAMKDQVFFKREEKLLKQSFNAEIVSVEQEFNCTFLEATGILFRKFYKTEPVLSQIHELNEYFSVLASQPERFIVFLSGGDDVSKYWNKVKFPENWNLKSDLTNCMRYSFAAVIDLSANKILEVTNETMSSLNYNIPDTDIKMEILCTGFNGRNFYADIICNMANGNIINYSMSKRGLNICVFDRNIGKVCDVCNVDLFADPELQINRVL